MTNELSVEERVALLVAADDVRFDYFIQTTRTHNQVWTLSNDQGFVMVETDEGDCVMLWPDEAFAAQWATDDWDDCVPIAIELTQFKTTWLPSLDADAVSIAVFPNIEDEGKLVTAQTLKAAYL